MWTVVSGLRLLALGAAGTLAACSLAPVYQKPATAPPPDAYKEAGHWKAAQPADLQPRGAWWGAYGDSQLDALEGKVSDSNQDLKAAFARLQQARAQMRFVRASYFPTISACRDNADFIGNRNGNYCNTRETAHAQSLYVDRAFNLEM
jgi:multidrug efflux system outer membrane protein